MARLSDDLGMWRQAGWSDVFRERFCLGDLNFLEVDADEGFEILGNWILLDKSLWPLKLGHHFVVYKMLRY